MSASFKNSSCGCPPCEDYCAALSFSVTCSEAPADSPQNCVAPCPTGQTMVSDNKVSDFIASWNSLGADSGATFNLYGSYADTGGACPTDPSGMTLLGTYADEGESFSETITRTSEDDGHCNQDVYTCWLLEVVVGGSTVATCTTTTDCRDQDHCQEGGTCSISASSSVLIPCNFSDASAKVHLLIQVTGTCEGAWFWSLTYPLPGEEGLTTANGEGDTIEGDFLCACFGDNDGPENTEFVATFTCGRVTCTIPLFIETV